MYSGFGVGVSMVGLRKAPGKEKGRAAERARLTDFDGPGVGVEGGPEGRGKGMAMGPVASWGEPAAKVSTEIGKAFLSGCCMCEDGDRGGDGTRSFGAG
jgi:hypothetical protein